ncbi:MAG: hypothetical protein ACPGXL_02900 [Chitinophagales bacterium]
MQKIYLPKPCKESWKDMSPTEQGRFCGKCQHIVHDFTDKSTAEIIDFLQQSTHRVCGKFGTNQITPHQKSINFLQKLRRWVLAPLSFVGFLTVTSVGIQAQNDTLTQTPVQEERPVSRSIRGGLRPDTSGVSMEENYTPPAKLPKTAIRAKKRVYKRRKYTIRKLFRRPKKTETWIGCPRF